MVKQFRKAKRRASPERADRVAEAKHEADIAELWEVLQEQRPHTPWIPWRHGQHACGLALDAARAWSNATTLNGLASPAPIDLLYNIDWSPHARHTSETYHRLQELLQEIQPLRALPSVDEYIDLKLVRAALRIAQLQIANSSGGGHAFNSLLLDIDWHEIPDYQQLIRRWRCMDATGINPDERGLGPHLDRTRRAFFTAWDRGLYTVAYAVSRP